jgi:hypothetical protein
LYQVFGESPLSASLPFGPAATSLGNPWRLPRLSPSQESVWTTSTVKWSISVVEGTVQASEAFVLPATVTQLADGEVIVGLGRVGSWIGVTLWFGTWVPSDDRANNAKEMLE